MVALQIRRSTRCLVGEGRAIPEAWGSLGAGFGGIALDDDMVAAFERAKRKWPTARVLVIDKVERGLILKTQWTQLWVDGVMKLEAPYAPSNPVGQLLIGLGTLLGL